MATADGGGDELEGGGHATPARDDTEPGGEVDRYLHWHGAARAREGGLAQLLEELAALLFPEALDTPGVADADFLHDPACFDLAETGQALENGEDLHFPNDLIALALVQEFVQRYRAHLEAVF
jgi:hypothetical protein